MKKAIFLAMLIALPAVGQMTRYDAPPLSTIPSNPPPVGSYPTLVAIPGATIFVCQYTGSSCSTPVPTYTDSTGVTACPENAQITQNGSGFCQATTSSKGAWGFWWNAASYPHIQYTITTAQGRFGPYDLTASGNGSGGASFPSTSALVTNTGIFTSRNAIPNDIASVLAGLSGCSTAGQVYSPASGACVSPGGGAAPNPPAFSIQASNTGVTGLTSVSNAQINTALQQAVNKLPRVNVLHTDFAAGCANGADPTGTLDSGCAIQNAVNYAETYPVTGTGTNAKAPCVYLPNGTYAFAGTITITKSVDFCTDGRNAVTLLHTGTSAGSPNTSSAVVVYQAFNVNISDITISGQGSFTTGPLVEVIDSQDVRFDDVYLTNNRGRCLIAYGSSERAFFTRLTVDECSWPIVESGNTNENHYFASLVQNAGVTVDGYNTNVNATNGVFPSPSTGVCSNYPSWTANTYYKGGTPICDGTNIEQAQFDFTSGTSAPTWATSRLAFTSETNGVSWTNAWQNRSNDTPLISDYHMSVVLQGQLNSWIASSIKSTAYMGGIKTCSDGCFFTTSYIEGFLNGDNPAIITNLPPDHFVTSGSVTGSATVVPLVSTQWIPDYLAEPSYVQANPSSDIYYWFPCDFLANSTAQSSCAPTGVQRGMYEVVYVDGASSDGNLYVQYRNVNGSTAPSGTAWPSGSFLMRHNSSYASPNLISMHPNSMDSPTTGYFFNCNDLSNRPCGDMIASEVPDGQVVNNIGSGIPSLNAFVFQEGSLNFVGTQSIYNSPAMWSGAGWVKCIIACKITGDTPLSVTNNTTVANAITTTGISMGPTSAGYIGFVSTGANGTGNAAQGEVLFPGLNYHNGDQTLAYEASTPGGTHWGSTFTNRTCWADSSNSTTEVSPTGQPLIVRCLRGGPTLTGGEETWGWNGTAYVLLDSGTVVNPGTTNVAFNRTLNGTLTLNSILAGSTGAQIPLLNQPNNFQDGVFVGQLQNLLTHTYNVGTVGPVQPWTVNQGTGTTTALSTDVGSPASATGTSTKMVSSSANYQILNEGTTLTPGTAYRVCIYARGAVGGEAAALGFDDTNQNLTLTTAWTPYCVNGTADNINNVKTILITNSVSGNTIYFDYPWAAPVSIGYGYTTTSTTTVTTPFSGVQVGDQVTVGGGNVNLIGSAVALLFNGSAGTSGQCPISGGAGITPAWNTCGTSSLPTGTTNQMLYYASGGTTVTTLTLGTNLSITSGVLNASSTGATAFSALTSSTNTTAAMVVGSGASLAATGSGTITATNLASYPTLCTGSQVSQGLSSGSNNCVTVTQTIASGTQALGTSAIAAGACATTLSPTATGVASTDNVQVDFNGSPLGVTGWVPSTNGVLTIFKWPSTNAINISVCNLTASSVTPGAMTVNWRVTR